jgi:hypothetical protein
VLAKFINFFFLTATLLFLNLTLTGCALFQALGDTVESLGEGAGHAVAGTGRAISRAAGSTSETINDFTDPFFDNSSGGNSYSRSEDESQLSF